MKVSDVYAAAVCVLNTLCMVAATPITRDTTSTSIAQTNGRLFTIGGKTEYFAGTNAWWLGQLNQDEDVEIAMSQIASSGLKVVRVWAFGAVNSPVGQTGVYYQVVNETLAPKNGSLINFSSTNGIGRLDSAVKMAKKYGIQLVMVMLNNWSYPGGISIYNTAFGGTATSFFTDIKSQAAYRNYISFIVKRYKDSGAIFSWELCNEPRCQGCNSSVITNWASDTSAYIKSIDSRHMVAIGDEGWFYPPEGDGSYAYSGVQGVDFVKNIAIKTIDYATFHLYPDQWGYNFTWGSTWIEQHDAIGKMAGKPVVLEEYGSPYANNHTAITQPWQNTVVQSTSIAYDSEWQFATQLPSGAYEADTYAIYFNTTTGSDYHVLFIQHAANMLAKRAVANMK
ncbi:MAG: hypothetical protein MMC33_009292 [Icmadophila ericetorum]|nr:hypothetical protein [Icmadophila ericetorum]